MPLFKFFDTKIYDIKEFIMATTKTHIIAGSIYWIDDLI
jgi:hypothetical protein